MIRKGGLKPGRLVDLIDECNDITQNVILGTDAAQLRIDRAVKLVQKIRNLWIVISKDIQEKMMEIAQQRYRVKCKSCSEKMLRKNDSSNWWRYEIECLGKMIDERYYKHHGRGTEKHWLVREEEERMRILRRKVVHAGNNLAAEKKLINDLKTADEECAKIIADGLEYKQYFSQKFDSFEDMENQIKVCRAELNQMNEREYAKKLIYAKVEFSDKNLRNMVNEMKKTREMEVEILALLQSSYKTTTNK